MRIVVLALALWSAEARAECIDYNADPGKLVDLEPTAGKGALTKDQIACLETSYKAATVQTTKGKISRVELVNAYAYDTDEWAQLVQRHLDEVDRSDPNIAYLYAFYLFNRDKPDYQQVIKWCDVALERRDEWSGDVLVTRALNLYKTRTYAAVGLWKAAEESKASNAEDLRNETKTSAREWADFAKSAKKDANEAEQICISAASRQACGLQ